jgi:hypothetical protein
MKSLAKLCEKNKTTLTALAKASGIHLRTLNKISIDPNQNVTIRVIQAIYDASGFNPWQYLNIKKAIFNREVGSEE